MKWLWKRSPIVNGMIKVNIKFNGVKLIVFIGELYSILLYVQCSILIVG